MYFASKRDWWLGAVLICAAAIELGVLVLLFPLDLVAFGWTLAIALASGLFVVWIWRTTGYRFTDRGIDVRSGPFRWLVAYDAISAVRRTRNPLSSPALSLDRLELVYGRGARILVSPENQARFLDEIRQRCPAARIIVE